eukprot:268797-Pleurochrysis_carterae.AAC.2
MQPASIKACAHKRDHRTHRKCQQNFSAAAPHRRLRQSHVRRQNAAVGSGDLCKRNARPDQDEFRCASRVHIDKHDTCMLDEADIRFEREEGQRRQRSGEVKESFTKAASFGRMMSRTVHELQRSVRLPARE